MVEALIADPDKLSLGGTKKVMSIMFCDVRGFTTISEALKDTPEKLTAQETAKSARAEVLKKK